MSYQVNLRSTKKPADYDGAEANVATPANDSAQKANDTYTNMASRLKKTAKPADYDGAEPNISGAAGKKADEKNVYDIKLKKVAQ
ncbi:hypothetical protein RI367_002190 [Sorochytrium milnesiophthora]